MASIQVPIYPPIYLIRDLLKCAARRCHLVASYQLISRLLSRSAQLVARVRAHERTRTQRRTPGIFDSPPKVPASLPAYIRYDRTNPRVGGCECQVLVLRDPSWCGSVDGTLGPSLVCKCFCLQFHSPSPSPRVPALPAYLPLLLGSGS